MNFLAHLHTSSPHEKEMAGNFFGDFVKGKHYLNFENEIKNGIVMHRKIDFFTDKAEETRNCKVPFRESYGLYSGIIIDLLYDHFLAKNWNSYATKTLDEFSTESYEIIIQYAHLFPSRAQTIGQSMKRNKRLQSYQTLSGINEAYTILGNHTSFPYQQGAMMNIIEQEYSYLEKQFSLFYDKLLKQIPTFR